MISSYPFVLACAVLAFLPAALADDESGQLSTAEQVAKARELIAQGRVKEARKIGKQLSSKPETRGSGYFVQAAVEKAAKKRSKALKLAKQAVAADPSSTAAQALLARLLHESGDPLSARATLEKVLNQHPRSPDACVLAGDLTLSECSTSADANHSLLRNAADYYKEALRLGYVDHDLIGLRVEALENALDFGEHVGDPAYQNPNLTPGESPGDIPPSAISTNVRRERVVLGLVISAQGEVAVIHHFAGLHQNFIDEAVKIASQLKFAPARRNGVPVPMWAVAEMDVGLPHAPRPQRLSPEP